MATLAAGSAIPRAGLARALAGHVARGFGSCRPRRRVLRGLVELLESYNDELHRPEPISDVTARRLAASVLDVWSTLERVGRDERLGDRVVTLAAKALSELGDATVPECVLFLRVAVTAGVAAADVPAPAHDQLDRFAIALGLAWEAERGELTPAGWRGGLGLLGQSVGDSARVPIDAGARAAHLARDVLAGLPAQGAAPLAELVAQIGEQRGFGTRRCTQYEPFVTQRVCAVTAPPSLGGFTAKWRPRLEDAMTALARGSSDAFARATAYLQAQGGKRFRGLLVLAAAEAAGGDPARALTAAAAVEWLHQTSLILDDIVDEAQVRRGSRCLHRLTSPTFTVATSAFLLSRCREVTRAMSPAIGRALSDAELALLKGECLEVSLAPGARASLNTYYRIVDGKTAELFAGAATVGALCADANPARARALATYGREIGFAFQLIDDVLDYTGDEATLGKRPGTDFVNGRLTLPAILLAESTTIPEHADFAWTRDAIASHDVAARCRERGRRHVERALAALSAVPASDARGVLERLAWAILDRSS